MFFKKLGMGSIRKFLWGGDTMELFALFLIYSVFVAALLAVLIKKQYRHFYVPVKAAASIAFLLAAVYAGIQGSHAMLFSLLPAFFMCFFGDLFLGFHYMIQKKKLFLAGILTFLMGHILFLAVFLQIQPLSVWDFLFPVCAIGITAAVTAKRHMVLGALRPYVYVYSFFVAMLFAKSVHIFLAMPQTGSMMRAAGAGLFLMSDFLILYLYFYERHPWSTHGWNLALYYYGMFLLAVSQMYC